MATIREYEQGAERGFQVRGWADGKQYKRRFPAPVDARGRLSMKRAEAAARAFQAEQDNAKYTGAAPALDRKTTVAQYAEAWAETKHTKRSTTRRVATDVKYIANSSLGSRPLYAVKPSEVQTWVNNCSKGTGGREALAPGTVRNRYITLKAVFAAAVDDQLIGRSPCLKRIALPKADKVEFQPLSLDQVDLLADAMPNRYRAMVLTQAGLGLRVGELLALQRRDVDFLRHTVRIERQQSDEGANLFEPTKNGVKRSVPLPQAVADALAAHLAAEPQEELHGLIFRSRFGNGLRQDYYTLRVLRPAVVKVGLTGTTSHDLRHHFVSLALSQGVPIPKVAAWIGDTVKTVDEFYAHDMPDTEAQNLAAMNDAWARARQARSGRAGAAAR